MVEKTIGGTEIKLPNIKEPEISAQLTNSKLFRLSVKGKKDI